MRRLMPLLFLLAAACGSDFPPYNRLTSLRVLGVRADSPIIRPGQSTTLTALVYHPEDSTPAYSWSWCPFRGGNFDGYECQVSSDGFSSAVGVPVTFDLGTGATASIMHSIPPESLEFLCTPSPVSSPQEVVALPDCKNGLPISIELTVTVGDDQVRALKTIYLGLSDTQALNQNPAIGAILLGEEDVGKNEAIPLEVDQTPDVGLGKVAELFVEVPEAAAEEFDNPGESSEQRETLAMTWFVQAGSTKFTRTSFIDGSVGFHVLGHNQWEVPQPETQGPGETKLYFVLRDNRGGLDWTSRTVLLVQP